MDPTHVPIFVYDYSFVLDAEDYITEMITYKPSDWRNLGSGQYVIVFRKDFSLRRDWKPVLEKFAYAMKAIYCWDRKWDTALEKHKRESVVSEAKLVLDKNAKEEKEALAVLEAVEELHKEDVLSIGALRELMTILSVDNEGRSIMYNYRPDGQKNCLPEEMVELKNVDPYACMALTDILPCANLPSTKAELATKPVLQAGVTCLRKWMPKQKKQITSNAPDGFVVVDDPECTLALQAISGTHRLAYDALVTMFQDNTKGAASMMQEHAQFADYFKSKSEYTQTSPTYDDMLTLKESGGRHITYLKRLYLLDPVNFSLMMEKLARSRAHNYHLKLENNPNSMVNVIEGLKFSMEIAFWVGRPAFNTQLDKLWRQDVEGPLMFAKKHDADLTPLYETKRAEYQASQDKVVAEAKARMEHGALMRADLKTFAALKVEIADARALHGTDQAAFDQKYPNALIAGMKLTDPDRYMGLLSIVNPKSAGKLFALKGKIPKVPEGEMPIQPGDQEDYHKYLVNLYLAGKLGAYSSKLEALKKRVAPFFMTEQEYYAPGTATVSYDEVIAEILKYNLPFKYFFVVKLTDNETAFNREMARLDYSKTLLISKVMAPESYSYLRNLIWLKPDLERDRDVVPLLMDWTTVGHSRSMY